VQLGDRQALEALYDRYCKLVYSISLRVLHDPTSAEDALQDIFMRIWERPECLPVTGGSLSGWMAMVSRNRSIDILRRQHPEERAEDLHLVSPFDLASRAEHELLCEKARALINQLSVEHRFLIEMAFFEGRSYSQIAAGTGCPLGTIKSRIRVALLILRRGSTSTRTIRVQAAPAKAVPVYEEKGLLLSTGPVFRTRTP
jgi:RNA polymerase sigma-70 factor, ECF subfamily